MKSEAAGFEKSTFVKPASTTGLPPSTEERVNFSGVPFAASTAIFTDSTVEPDCFGLITSWYASRPATFAVPSTVIDVVSPAAFRTSSASCLGVPGSSLPFGPSWAPVASAPAGAFSWKTSLDLLSYAQTSSPLWIRLYSSEPSSRVSF